MKKIITLALATGVALTAVAPAMAREGCGPGGHRGPYGHCRPNRGPVIVERGGPALVVGNFYNGRGYWDGRRYYHNRERFHGGWRYR